MSELSEFIQKYVSNGHNTKDLFSVRRESNADLITVLKCLGMKDEGVLNNPGLDVLLDNICYQISVLPHCFIDFDEEHNRIKFSSNDGDKEFSADLSVEYGSHLSYGYGYSYKDSDKNQCYYDFKVDCSQDKSNGNLKFTEYSQHQTNYFSKSKGRNERSYNSSLTTRLFDECGVEFWREEGEFKGINDVRDSGKLDFVVGSHPYKSVRVRRDYFDVAWVTEFNASHNTTNQYMTVLNNEHGLQQMQLPGYAPDVIEPLSDEEIAKKIQHNNSPIVQKSLMEWVKDRGTYRYLNDSYELEGTGKSR